MSAGYILLVEDNGDDEELTRIALQRGHIANELLVAHDGAEAVEMLLGARARPEPPHLVMLDLKLPKLTGLEVLERLRAEPRLRTVPVVILTSSSEEEDIVAGYLLGANSYVRKPVAFQDFMAAVQQLGLYWLLLNQPAHPERLTGS